MVENASAAADESERVWDVIVVGAGPSGIGCGMALTHADVGDFLILDRHEVGASFARWPAETRFITPSFNSNQFGTLDLNSFGLRLSPAFTTAREHPTGREYAKFLRDVTTYVGLPVRTGVDVLRVEPLPGGGFRLDTSAGTFRATFVIWAAGEFQYPKGGGFPGAGDCVHSATVASWRALAGDDFVVVGGNESGIDAAVNLVACGKSVRVLDRERPWEKIDSDPSAALSTYTAERLEAACGTRRVELLGNSPVAEVRRRKGGGFLVRTTDGGRYSTPVPPILATGFDTSLVLVKDQFAWAGGRVNLTADDESTTTSGLFLVGPQVWHDQVIFCFIYKFRQRFAVVVRAIADRLGRDTGEFVGLYRSKGMYLDDLSCCKEACETC